MPLRASTNPLIPRGQTSAVDVTAMAQRVKSSRLPSSQDMYDALSGLQQNVNNIYNILRNSNPVITDLQVVDAETGLLVAHIGDWQTNGFPYRGIQVIEAYIGDSVGNRDPADAPFHATEDGQVIIGQGGSVDVLDPYGNQAAWLGAQFDTLDVTGAIDNGSADHLIRLTVTSNPFLTGFVLQVENVGGVPNARGFFTITKIDANHIDLQNSIFAGTYTSGGTVSRVLPVTGAANNGSGLIRLTVTAHGYEDADQVSVDSVGGVPNATGQWLITVVDADHIDLRNSTFAGAYTSGGTCLRYFAGGLFQNVAVGPSFPNYTLRAFPDGTLKIRNASIIIDANDVVTTINNYVDGTYGTVSLDSHNKLTGWDMLVADEGFIIRGSDGSSTVAAMTVAGAATDDRGQIQLNHLNTGIRIQLATGGAGAPFVFVTDGVNSTNITQNAVDSPGYIVGGVPGATVTIDGVNTASGVNGLTVTTGTAVTSVSGVGVSSTTGSFVTAVTLATTAHASTAGIVTS